MLSDSLDAQQTADGEANKFTFIEGADFVMVFRHTPGQDPFMEKYKVDLDTGFNLMAFTSGNEFFAVQSLVISRNAGVGPTQTAFAATLTMQSALMLVAWSLECEPEY